MSALGDNIKKYRIQCGMSQAQLAERIGKTRSAVSQYESGEIIPRMGVIESLAAVFGITKSQLLEDFTGGISHKSDLPASSEQFVQTITSTEYELLLLYRRMGDRERELLMQNARAFAQLSGAGALRAGRAVGRAVMG